MPLGVLSADNVSTGLPPDSAPQRGAQGLRFLDRLRDAGRVTSAQYESLFHQVRRTGEPVIEALIEQNVLSEADALKLAAHHFQTKFVSTERLAKAGIDRQMLQLVPRKLAERFFCFPVILDKRTQALSVVVSEVDADVAKQIQLATQVREVIPHVARPAAIQAAIRKHYGGDPSAFARILPRSVSRPPSRESKRPSGLPKPDFGLDFEVNVKQSPPPRAAARPRPQPVQDLDMGNFDAGTLGSFEAAPDYKSFIETVSVLVTLLEQDRGELRGHSAFVARVASKMAERLNLPNAERNALAVAAHLHDVGKASSTYHLTALNVSRFDGHRMQAQKSYAAPTRLFETARLPELTQRILDSLYERWDGQGFPKNLPGKDIPTGARILAMVETYADLTANTKNPYRRVLSPKEAVDVVRQLAGQLFDPGLVDHLRLAVVADDPSRAGVHPRLLLVEPDGDEAMMLELRLEEQGFEVVAVKTRADAEAKLRGERFDILLSEVEINGEDGFAMIASMRADAKNKDVPAVFYSRRTDRETIARGFELGAADFLSKPTSPEVMSAKLAQILESSMRRKGGGGLSGSLREMGLAEVVQVLAQGRKTGQLRLATGLRIGELYFNEGQVVHALFGPQRGEEAFYAMVALREGDFSFDPNQKPAVRTIEAATESLLLEAMRRLDEGGAT